jgi:hypothetical protein
MRFPARFQCVSFVQVERDARRALAPQPIGEIDDRDAAIVRVLRQPAAGHIGIEALRRLPESAREIRALRVVDLEARGSEHQDRRCVPSRAIVPTSSSISARRRGQSCGSAGAPTRVSSA